jgi:hypothetical protein
MFKIPPLKYTKATPITLVIGKILELLESITLISSKNGTEILIIGWDILD